MKLWVQLEDYIVQQWLPKFLGKNAFEYLPISVIAGLFAVGMCWWAFTGRYSIERRIAGIGALLFAITATVLVFPDTRQFVQTQPSTLFALGIVLAIGAVIANEILKRRDARQTASSRDSQ